MGLFRDKMGAKSEERPETPRKLFDLLRGRTKIPFLWGHQERILDEYWAKGSKEKDLALELPTGSGKTLIGLLIGEFHRRTNDSRIVYVCPTRQLGHQTQDRAKQYGIPTAWFGKKNEYDQNELNAYQRAKTIAITTYSGIFNASPGLTEPQVIICDDAHAGESFVADHWSLKVDHEEHDELFEAMFAFFGDWINPSLRHAKGNASLSDVDLIPLPAYAAKLDKLGRILGRFCGPENAPKSVRYAWRVLKDHLASCNIYVSPTSFLIRPLIPPTDTHPTFANADHRLYMSATLGADGDLERMFGVRKIKAIEASDVPEGNTGRRLILLPHLMAKDAATYCYTRAVGDSRSLVIVSGTKQEASRLARSLRKSKVATLNADDVEESLEKFTNTTVPTALVLTNRYDGIDLPGESCRRMLLVNAPAVMNLQESFMRNRLNAYSVLRNRMRVRLTQAMGRCTRDKNDYALVLCLGKDLTGWIAVGTNSRGLHPELQAELDLGQDVSNGLDIAKVEQLLKDFFEHGDAWNDDAEEVLRERTKSLDRVLGEETSALAATAGHETMFVYQLWRADYAQAHHTAVKITDQLGDPKLKPYRAFWEYQAALAADMAYRTSNDESHKLQFQRHVELASNLASGVRWLASLSFIRPETAPPLGAPMGVDEVIDLLNDWTFRGKKFGELLEKTRKDVSATAASQFQAGLTALGRMLGFQTKSYKKEQGAPDTVWWTQDGQRYVFEAKSDEKPGFPISYETVRQARAHPTWLEAHDKSLPPARDTKVIVVSPRHALDDTGRALASGIAYLSLNDVKKLFDDAAACLDHARTRCIAVSEDLMRETISDEYARAHLNGDALLKRLVGKMLDALPS
jgi:Rad3-related DNA helicase